MTLEELPDLPHSKVASSKRNLPCPCGSGKKHKKCCATGKMAAAAVRVEKVRQYLIFQMKLEKERREIAELRKRRRTSILPVKTALATAAILAMPE